MAPLFPFSIFSSLANYSSAVQRQTLTGTVCGVEALKHLMQLSDINTNTGGGHKVCIIDFSGWFVCSGGEEVGLVGSRVTPVVQKKALHPSSPPTPS